MKINNMVNTAIQPVIDNHESAHNSKSADLATPAYKIELTGTNSDTNTKIKPVLNDMRINLGGQNDACHEEAMAMKKSIMTQKPLLEITATEMSMDLLSNRNGDVSAGIYLGILKTIYAGTNHFDSDVVTKQENFLQVANNINSEGEKGFLRYNKMFASIAKEATEATNEGTIEKWIKDGTWSESLEKIYQNAKAYASELQEKSGVLIGVDFKYKSTEYLSGANNISSAYLGSFAQVGVNLLNFMSQHHEAESVWVKAVQGEYNDSVALYDALKKQGYGDIAAALQENINNSRNNFNSGAMKLDDSVAQFSYSRNMGELWRESIGEDGYKLFTDRFNLHSVSITYTAKDLADIADEASENFAALRKNPIQRDKSGIIADNKKDSVEQKHANGIDEQIAALQDKIKRIRQQMSALLKNPSLSPEELTQKTQNYQKQIDTYQRQIMEIKIQQMERQKYSQ